MHRKEHTVVSVAIKQSYEARKKSNDLPSPCRLVGRGEGDLRLRGEEAVLLVPEPGGIHSSEESGSGSLKSELVVESSSLSLSNSREFPGCERLPCKASSKVNVFHVKLPPR